MTKEQVTDAETADIAADVLGNDLVAITSVPDGESSILTICSGDAAAEAYASPRLDEVPHGTGDLFAALLLGHILNGHAHTDAVARAAAGVAHVIERSLGARELNLVSTIRDAIMCEPIDGRSIPRPG